MNRFLPSLLLIFSSLVPAYADTLDGHESSDSSQAIRGSVITDFRVNRRDLTPAAKTTVTGEDIKEMQATSLKELSAVIPNFFMPDYAARTTAPVYIRGIGMKSDGTATAFYVDGVPYYEPITFETDLSDIASVEVLRGPQGTLFGRNSLGGAINIRTLSPFDTQGTKVRAGFGNYNDIRSSASTNILIGRKFGISAGAVFHHGGGYFKNAFNGKKTDVMDETEEHLGLFFKPSDRLRLHVTSRLAYSDQGGYSYAPYDTETEELSNIDYNRPSGFRRLVSTTGLSARYQTDNVSLSSQTSFQYLKSHQYVDQDYTSADKTYLLADRHQNMVSEELTAKSDNDGRYQWVTGVFGMFQHVNRDVTNDHPSALSTSFSHYRQPTSALAIYHQSSYNLWKGLSVSAGLRFDLEHTHSLYARETLNGKTGDSKISGNFDKGMSFNQLTPRFSVQYLTSGNDKLYLMASRGYKSGGFNRSIASEAEQEYKPEYSWNYEAGASLTFFRGKLSIDAALFYIDWKDTQLTYTYVGIGTLTTNAGHADSKGAEISVSANPAEGLRLGLTYGLTVAKFVSYEKSEDVSYTGNRLPMVPKNTLSANVNYTFKRPYFFDTVTLGAFGNGIGDIYWAEDNLVRQPFYFTANAKASFTKGILTLELWGKNLFSKEYLANVMTVSTGSYAQKGKPFTMGAGVEVAF